MFIKILKFLKSIDRETWILIVDLIFKIFSANPRIRNNYTKTDDKISLREESEYGFFSLYGQYLIDILSNHCDFIGDVRALIRFLDGILGLSTEEMNEQIPIIKRSHDNQIGALVITEENLDAFDEIQGLIRPLMSSSSIHILEAVEPYQLDNLAITAGALLRKLMDAEPSGRLRDSIPVNFLRGFFNNQSEKAWLRDTDLDDEALMRSDDRTLSDEVIMRKCLSNDLIESYVSNSTVQFPQLTLISLVICLHALRMSLREVDSFGTRSGKFEELINAFRSAESEITEQIGAFPDTDRAFIDSLVANNEFISSSQVIEYVANIVRSHPGSKYYSLRSQITGCSDVLALASAVCSKFVGKFLFFFSQDSSLLSDSYYSAFYNLTEGESRWLFAFISNFRRMINSMSRTLSMFERK